MIVEIIADIKEPLENINNDEQKISANQTVEIIEELESNIATLEKEIQSLMPKKISSRSKVANVDNTERIEEIKRQIEEKQQQKQQLEADLQLKQSIEEELWIRALTLTSKLLQYSNQ